MFEGCPTVVTQQQTTDIGDASNAVFRAYLHLPRLLVSYL